MTATSTPETHGNRYTTGAQDEVLVHLEAHGPVHDTSGAATSKLKRRMRRKSSTASLATLLYILERDGFIKRDKHAAARRTYGIELTEAGSVRAREVAARRAGNAVSAKDAKSNGNGKRNRGRKQGRYSQNERRLQVISLLQHYGGDLNTTRLISSESKLPQNRRLVEHLAKVLRVSTPNALRYVRDLRAGGVVDVAGVIPTSEVSAANPLGAVWLKHPVEAVRPWAEWVAEFDAKGLGQVQRKKQRVLKKRVPGEVREVTATFAIHSEIDYDALAASLLAQVLDAAHAQALGVQAPTAGLTPEATEALESRVEDLEREVRDAHNSLASANAEVVELTAQVATRDHNLEVMRKALDDSEAQRVIAEEQAKTASRTGFKVREMLNDDQREALDRLIRQAPGTAKGED